MGLEDYRTAKRCCFALAEQLGLSIGQGNDSKPLLFRAGSPPARFATWLALATHLQRLAADRQPKPPAVQSEPAPEDWTCAKCGHRNLSRYRYCDRCNVPRPKPPKTEVAPPVVLPVARVIGRAPTKCDLPYGRIVD